MNEWTWRKSAELTATFLVVDGIHMPAAQLHETELRAALRMAHRLQVRRAVLAERIGWTKNHLWKWAKDHRCAWHEDNFPDEPLAWCTRAFNRGLPFMTDVVPEVIRPTWRERRMENMS